MRLRGFQHHWSYVAQHIYRLALVFENACNQIKEKKNSLSKVKNKMCLQQRKLKILLNFINNYCTSVAILELKNCSWDKQQWNVKNRKYVKV
jgi:hypothetical protein